VVTAQWCEKERGDEPDFCSCFPRCAVFGKLGVAAAIPCVACCAERARAIKRYNESSSECTSRKACLSTLYKYSPCLGNSRRRPARMSGFQA